jgi:hypothetical protein
MDFSILIQVIVAGVATGGVYGLNPAGNMRGEKNESSQFYYL